MTDPVAIPVKQTKGHKGSQKWLRIAVDKVPGILERELKPLLAGNAGHISWMSPRAQDKFREYRDEACLKKLNISLDDRPLNSFWPSRGPVWDALGVTSTGQLLLVEAKAHIPEMVSGGSRAGE